MHVGAPLSSPPTVLGGPLQNARRAMARQLTRLSFLSLAPLLPPLLSLPRFLFSSYPYFSFAPTLGAVKLGA